MTDVPNYLSDHATTWQQDPKQANLDWFADAKWACSSTTASIANWDAASGF